MLDLVDKMKIGFLNEFSVGLAFFVVISFEMFHERSVVCTGFAGGREDYRIKVYDVAELSVDRNCTKVRDRERIRGLFKFYPRF